MAKSWHSFKSFYRLLPLLPVSPVKGQQNTPQSLDTLGFYSFYRSGTGAFTAFELLPLLPAIFSKPVKGQKAIKNNTLQTRFELLPDSFYREAGKSSQVIDFTYNYQSTGNYPLKGVKKAVKARIFTPPKLGVPAKVVKAKKQGLSFPAKEGL